MTMGLMQTRTRIHQLSTRFLCAGTMFRPSRHMLRCRRSLGHTNLHFRHLHTMFPHRETTTVKKSKFQATAAIIESSEDVKKVLSEIHQNKKFKKASHHIYAYIVAGEEGCNDDGETGASIRILKMLHSEGYNNVLVCVTRWYGGVKMGPERFRVITKCAREHLKSVPELN